MLEKGLLRTDVDDFLDLLKQKEKIAIQDAAKILKTSIETVQSWVDFLVEERIVGIEYKFTTPYVYLEEKKKPQLKGVQYIGFETKDVFIEKAKKRGLNKDEANMLWFKYLDMNKDAMKQSFYEKAKEKGLKGKQIEELWINYWDYLVK